MPASVRNASCVVSHGDRARGAAGLGAVHARRPCRGRSRPAARRPCASAPRRARRSPRWAATCVRRSAPTAPTCSPHTSIARSRDAARQRDDRLLRLERARSGGRGRSSSRRIAEARPRRTPTHAPRRARDAVEPAAPARGPRSRKARAPPVVKRIACPAVRSHEPPDGSVGGDVDVAERLVDGVRALHGAVDDVEQAGSYRARSRPCARGGESRAARRRVAARNVWRADGRALTLRARRAARAVARAGRAADRACDPGGAGPLRCRRRRSSRRGTSAASGTRPPRSST